MFSVVEQDGFQFKVSQGDTILVPRINAEKGSEIAIEKVLMVGEAGNVKIGSPVVSGAVVKAKVVDHVKGDKLFILKKKRRKTFKKRTGHRQQHTTLQILSIQA
jgi:large subunit ribosomal protein L21